MNLRRSLSYLSVALIIGNSTSCWSNLGRTEQGVPQKISGKSGNAAPLSADEKKVAIRAEGWKIPQVSEGKILQPRHFHPSNKAPSAQIFMTEYKPKQSFTTEVYGLTPEERRILRLNPNQEFVFQSIMQYDIGGRIFCYAVLVGILNIDRATGSSDFCCTLWSIDFYDKDGDGVFKSLQLGPYYGFNPSVPQWALQNQ